MTKLGFAKQLSLGEEIANSVTHGLGALAMLVLLPISAIYAYRTYNLTAVVGFCIFISSLFLMFLSSSLYHAMVYGSKEKSYLRVVDHSMIFIAIAGSYTPLALSLLGGTWGLVLLVLEWALAIGGICYKIFAKAPKEKTSLAFYLLMGWLIILLLPRLLQAQSPLFLVFLLAGGIAYSLGAIFYSLKKPYFHTIWHLFILAASCFHYIAIVFFML